MSAPGHLDGAHGVGNGCLGAAEMSQTTPKLLRIRADPPPSPPWGRPKRLQMTRPVSQLMQQNFFLRVSFAAPRVLFVGCYYFGDHDGKTSFQ
jgi:hypothetical protein